MAVSTSITLPELWVAYENFLGEATDVLELRRTEKQAGVPAELDILFVQPRARGARPFTYLATAGMSMCPMVDSKERIEITMRVDGSFQRDELVRLAQSLGELVTVPFRENLPWRADMILSDVRLPLFEHMSCALLVDRAVGAPHYLGGFTPPVRVLRLIPIFVAEADAARRCGAATLIRFISQQGENVHDPARSEGDLRLLSVEDSARNVSKAGPKNEMVASDVEHIWREIESLCRSNPSGPMQGLRGPVSTEDLTALKQSLQYDLPVDLKTSLLRHDGGISFNGYELLPVVEVLRFWRQMAGVVESGAFDGVDVVYAKPAVFEPVWWHQAWIPFAADSEGNLLCVDMAPGSEGKAGQVLRWERVEGPSETGHASFTDWLGSVRESLVDHKNK